MRPARCADRSFIAFGEPAVERIAKCRNDTRRIVAERAHQAYAVSAAPRGNARLAWLENSADRDYRPARIRAPPPEVVGALRQPWHVLRRRRPHRAARDVPCRHRSRATELPHAVRADAQSNAAG